MLGDVCGRGALAATTTALVRHTTRAVASFLPGPQAVVQAIDHALIKRHGSHGTGFVTLVYGHFTPAGTGLDVVLVRAGHPFPLHLTADDAHPVSSDGPLLGVLPEPPLSTCRFSLAPGESLVLYTDGITEARNSASELFDEDRLAQVLVPSPRRASEVLNTLTTAIHDFTDGRDVDDDQAVLILTATFSAPTARS